MKKTIKNYILSVEIPVNINRAQNQMLNDLAEENEGLKKRIREIEKQLKKLTIIS